MQYKKLGCSWLFKCFGLNSNSVQLDRESLRTPQLFILPTLWATETDGTYSETLSLEKVLSGDKIMPCG
jgi:hypothetical protein